VVDHRWSFSQLGRISRKVATAHGLVECGANGPMHLMNTTRTHQSAAPRSDLEHCDVQPLEMLRSQRCEAMTPNARYRVDADGSPIALIGAAESGGLRRDGLGAQQRLVSPTVDIKLADT
jgi:hypothetical protein